MTAVEPARQVLWTEWRRKRAHILPGLIPFVMWLIPHDDPLPWWNLLLVAIVAASLIGIGISSGQGRTRTPDESWRRTCLNYAVPPLAVLILFPAAPEFAAVALVTLAFGDAAAALGGRLWGKRSLPWNPRKTWVGLLSFVTVAAPIAALAYWGEAQNPSVPLTVAIACGFIAVMVGAIAESWPSRIDDNLRITLFSTVAVAASSTLFVG